MEGDRCGLHNDLVTSCIWRGRVGDRAVPEDVAQVGSDDSGTPFFPTVTGFISVPPAPTSLVPRFPGLVPAGSSSLHFFRSLSSLPFFTSCLFSLLTPLALTDSPAVSLYISPRTCVCLLSVSLSPSSHLFVSCSSLFMTSFYLFSVPSSLPGTVYCIWIT